jgi:hypothetical protein
MISLKSFRRLVRDMLYDEPQDKQQPAKEAVPKAK